MHKSSVTDNGQKVNKKTIKGAGLCWRKP